MSTKKKTPKKTPAVPKELAEALADILEDVDDEYDTGEAVANNASVLRKYAATLPTIRVTVDLNRKQIDDLIDRLDGSCVPEMAKNTVLTALRAAIK